MNPFQKRQQKAFIQADMFPGIGGQACLVWENGNRTHLEISGNAINHGIKEIDDSVWSADKEDEFECIHLGRFRYTDEWVEIAEIIILALDLLNEDIRNHRHSFRA